MGAALGDVLKFTGQICPIFYASRETVEWNGRTCERWVTMIRKPDGSEEWQGPYKAKSDAIAITGYIAKAEEKRRIERATYADDPLFRLVDSLSPDERRALSILLARDKGS
jgi:hypothetical protein